MNLVDLAFALSIITSLVAASGWVHCWLTSRAHIQALEVALAMAEVRTRSTRGYPTQASETVASLARLCGVTLHD